ncbi:hypothetical protein ABCS02_03450 [Microbacterium sp. X-17]|uniref:hypothetical protein n=1 Tax=Microbacterium sp. X-17 TaxID=3144404 RepID=UPI0031F4F5D1
MKVASNTAAAQAAVAGFANIEVDRTGQQVTLGSSNVASMKDGANVANGVLDSISALISGVKRQADGVTALATEIEARDKRDAASVGGKL